MWAKNLSTNSTFYYLNKIAVIEIFDWMRSLKNSKVMKNKYKKGWYAQVFFPNNKGSDLVSDNDLDVLKLKCLIRAKELGWIIDLNDYNSEEILEIETDYHPADRR